MSATTVLYTFISVVLVSLVSLVGIFTLSFSEKFLRKIVLLLVSFAAGTLLGSAFLHLIPEMIAVPGVNAENAIYRILFGILIFFALEKFIHWRHCHIVDEKLHPHPFAMVNLLGDGLHNVLDGVVIATSYLVDARVGVATTIAVVVHEIPTEIGDFAVLVHGGYSRAKALIMNLLTALGAVIGAAVTLVFGIWNEGVTNYILPVAAGSFIYLACVDLFPELHKESTLEKSLLQFLFIVLGIGVMMLLR